MADRLSRAKLARAAAGLNAGIGLPAIILLTDDERLPDPLAAARALPRGSMVIVRARDRRAKLAEALSRIVHARDLILLIANDPELAVVCRAHGIHLPEERAAEASYWRARRPNWLITCAAHSLHACIAARYADAILLGPVFATRSHPNAAALGHIRMRLIGHAVRAPIYALGGVDAGTVGNLSSASIAGIAAIGALSI